MMTAAATHSGPPSSPPPSPSSAARRRLEPRSFLARIALGVLGRWGARVGLAWIALLALLAVFAPFLASSYPILWKHDGRISSPLLEHFTPTDVTLLVTFFAAVIALFWRRSWWGGRPAHRVWAWVAVTVATAVLSAIFVRPPALTVYSSYREAAAAGEVQWAVYPPIPYSPNDRLRDVLVRSGAAAGPQTPNTHHWMGTTAAGSDVASRMIYSCRIDLAIGLIATGIAVAIGIAVGGVMGYFSGLVDLFGMRLVEIFSSIPTIFLLIMIVAVYGRSLVLMMVIIGLTGWVGYALFVRAEFLKLRSMDYVQAAKALGVPLRSILFRHMLPNGVTPVLVLASFGIASAILIESTLSFLGLGVVEAPSWGQMLNQARSAQGQWGLVIFPGLAIFLTVFAYNLIGEALRDALDPYTQPGQ